MVPVLGESQRRYLTHGKWSIMQQRAKASLWSSTAWMNLEPTHAWLPGPAANPPEGPASCIKTRPFWKQITAECPATPASLPIRTPSRACRPPLYPRCPIRAQHGLAWDTHLVEPLSRCDLSRPPKHPRRFSGRPLSAFSQGIHLKLKLAAWMDSTRDRWRPWHARPSYSAASLYIMFPPKTTPGMAWSHT